MFGRKDRRTGSRQNAIAKTSTTVVSETLFVEVLESRFLMSASTDISTFSATPLLTLSTDATAATSISGYTPAQIRHAYGLDQVSATGAGQTIAIVDAYDDPTIAADLAAFDAQFGVQAANLIKVGYTGSTSVLPSVDAGWAQEISLDVEWAHAAAPSATILLVEAKSSGLTDLLSAVDIARHAPGVSVVSISWGSSEFANESAYSAYFTTPAGHAGVTFVAASGDEGSASGAEWPAVAPSVLSVGGTTLLTSDTSGTYSSESAWSSSTGGTSRYIATPSYQSGVIGSTGRSTPDVSLDANPSTGYAVYDSTTYQGERGWMEFGGTSAGAPVWAGLIAMADQSRASVGESSLPGGAQTLPMLYSLYSSSYSSDFNDVTAGGTSGGGGFGGGFGFGRFRRSTGISATTGYDQVTGLGTPKAAAIIAALTGTTSGSASAVVASARVATSTASSKVHAALATATHPEDLTIVRGPVAPAVAAVAASQAATLEEAGQLSDGVGSTANGGESLAATGAQTLAAAITPSAIVGGKLLGEANAIFSSTMSAGHTMSLVMFDSLHGAVALESLGSSTNTSLTSGFSRLSPALSISSGLSTRLGSALHAPSGWPAGLTPALGNVVSDPIWRTTAAALGVASILVGAWSQLEKRRKGQPADNASPFNDGNAIVG